ncbi:unnamed protein product [Didymodactylos carnosus]|uniref:WD repeat-containing protein 89 n=1 Tax=Didymodactylos carnosus TaxID=1234261 RepID=A0A813UNG3_9BILA|nr:unnamed protein product [Didymodactylos carnosus]CAF0828475.1 unnamed protein product [Didymodactylos carnosus]CAF3502972.1 unnamed protein product [Didymodactylos carnosus]CAF3615428.1 unnamed protein product [Didymodactylos carnosus]
MAANSEMQIRRLPRQPGQRSTTTPSLSSSGLQSSNDQILYSEAAVRYNENSLEQCRTSIKMKTKGSKQKNRSFNKDKNGQCDINSPIEYSQKTSVRFSVETNDVYAIDLTINNTKNVIGVLTVPSTIQLYDTASLKLIACLSSTLYNFNDDSSIKINSIRFTQNNPDLLLASTNRNAVLIFDKRCPQQEVCQLIGCSDEHDFLSVTSNTSDCLIAAGSSLKNEDNVVIGFWDTRQKNQLLGYYTECHSDDILQLQFHRSKQHTLLSGSTDGLVCLYDINETNEDDALQQVFNANGSIYKCGFLLEQENENNGYIYAVTSSNSFSVWSTSDNSIAIEGDTNVNDELQSSLIQLNMDNVQTSEKMMEDVTDIAQLSSPSQTMSSELDEKKIKKKVHLSCDYIVDFVPELDSLFSNVSEFPSSTLSFSQQNNGSSTKSCVLLGSDNVGNIVLNYFDLCSPSDETQSSVFSQLTLPVVSPHSEIIRSFISDRNSSWYSCSDDGSLVSWKAQSKIKLTDQQTIKPKHSNDNRRPY